MSKTTRTDNTKRFASGRSQLLQMLRLGRLLCEKCEFREAEEVLVGVLKSAQKAKDLRLIMEVLSSLLQIAGHSLDASAIHRLEQELDEHMLQFPKQVPPMAWYCKGAIARHRSEYMSAQRYFLRYLRTARTESARGSSEFHTQEQVIARGWCMLAVTLFQRGHFRRAEVLTRLITGKFPESALEGVHGHLHLLLGNIASLKRDYEAALECYHKAHVSFLAEHNWFYYLYVLLSYAKVARMQQDYVHAYWYLDLVSRASAGPEFGAIRKEIAIERNRIESDAVDLLIDSKQGLIRTRENDNIPLGKQYVLLNILEALSAAHNNCGADETERGLSKAEIIQRVWNETYRPEAHDNKLYYNINRLRKLIEPDVRKPRYLLNWREGYRLAPDLKVRLVGSKVLTANRGDKT